VAQKHLASGKTPVAVQLLQELYRHRPSDPEVSHYLGVGLFQLGRFYDALQFLDQAHRLNPASGAILNHLGSVFAAIGEHVAAMNTFSRAIAIQPGSPDGYFNRGNSHAALKRYQDAVADYERALQCAPGHMPAQQNKGNALLELRRFASALTCFNKVLETNSVHAPALANRARALLELDCTDEALISAEHAIQISPKLADAHYERGNALRVLDRPGAAERAYEDAIALRSDYQQSHFALAILYLQHGRFDEGWREFEWRDRTEPPRFPILEQPPRWRGEPLAGRNILVYAEQGAGDTIQFCRFVIPLLELAASVAILVPQPIATLISRLNTKVTVATDPASVPPPDFVCPLLSLPLCLAARMKNWGEYVPYLKLDFSRVDVWSQRIGTRTKPKRVGIAWSGNPAHLNDRHRSVPLEVWSSMFDVHEVEFICLQTDVKDTDLSLMPHLPLREFRSDVKDFADSAALMANVDLVITVDTSIAHLAGAVAKPVWILLPLNPDWRWLLQRTDSPWYPSARLFRQQQSGNWRPVIENVRRELMEWAIR
jgi:tetratricopeptide (TPR) repeat protein